MVHGHGIQTMNELTSLPWRSAGFESFVMVSTEDYPEAPLREYRRTKVLKLVARHSPDHRVRVNPLPRPLVHERSRRFLQEIPLALKPFPAPGRPAWVGTYSPLIIFSKSIAPPSPCQLCRQMVDIRSPDSRRTAGHAGSLDGTAGHETVRRVD